MFQTRFNSWHNNDPISTARGNPTSSGPETPQRQCSPSNTWCFRLLGSIESFKYCIEMLVNQLTVIDGATMPLRNCLGDPNPDKKMKQTKPFIFYIPMFVGICIFANKVKLLQKHLSSNPGNLCLCFSQYILDSYVILCL